MFILYQYIQFTGPREASVFDSYFEQPYLRFQKYLIALIVVSNFFGVILLPINVSGNNYAANVTETQLARTTINNINPSDDLLFIHSLLSFLMFPISVYIMRRYSKGKL